MSSSFTPISESPPITAYEEQRNNTKKALHDAVQRHLLAAGFKDAAALRPLFSGEATSVVRDESSGSVRKTGQRKVRKRVRSIEDSVCVRRTRQNTAAAARSLLGSPSPRLLEQSTCCEVAESFSTWPGKDSQEKMKTKKNASKRKATESPTMQETASAEDFQMMSAGDSNLKDKGPSSSMQIEPVFSADHMNNIQENRRADELKGLPRPLQGGYEGPDTSRRGDVQWADHYRFQYAPQPRAQFDTAFRRPWSPNRYEGRPDFPGRVPTYGGRGPSFERRPEFPDLRDAYYDGRPRDFDYRPREEHEQRRYEDNRYSSRVAVPPDLYSRGMSETPAVPDYGRSNRQGSSPPPSSSATLTGSVTKEVVARRPLHLDKQGRPTGKMAILFRGDIISHVKDMDPTEGWRRQTAEGKKRLLERLVHDYDFYGESTKLSDKFLKKEAGLALIQFRYTLNQMIDKGQDMPPDFSPTYWNILVDRRKSDEAKEKSAQMATIARGRAFRNSTKKSLEQSVLLELSKELKREPYDAELKEAVDKQWAILQEDASKKRRERAATNATTSAILASKQLDSRLNSVETFIENWGPILEQWKGILSDVTRKDLQDPIVGNANKGKEVVVMAGALPSAIDNENADLYSDSSDDDDSKEKSQSSSDDESDSGDDTDVSADGEENDDKMQAASVVEADEHMKSPPLASKSTASKSLSRKPSSCFIPKVVISSTMGSKTVVSEVDSAVEQPSHLKIGPKLQTPDLMSKQNQDTQATRNATQKVLQQEHRPAKKMKVATNSVQEPLILEADGIGKSEREIHKPPETIRATRKNKKSEKRGGKKAN